MKACHSALKLSGFSVFILVLFIGFVHADVFLLKKGNRIVGKLVKETETHYVVATQELGEVSILKETVDRIVKEQSEAEKIKSLKTMPLDTVLESLIKAYREKPGAKPNPAIAIMPLQVEDPLLREEKIGFGVAEVMTDSLVEKWRNEFQVVERSRLVQTLSEQKLSLTGLISEDSAVKAGKLLGADILLVGSVSEMAGNYNINARLVSVETGQVLAAESVKSSRDDINKEALSYIDLPENFSAFFGFKMLNTPRSPWSVVSGTDKNDNPILNENNTDLTSVMFIMAGLRYFPVSSVMFEFQMAMNAISPNSYSYNQYVSSQLYDRQTASMQGSMSFSANLVQKFEPLFLYIGAGMSGINAANIDETGREDYSTVFLPTARAGLEWRFKKRVGVNIFADFLCGSKSVNVRMADGNTYKLYEVSPLVVSAFIAYYF